MNQLASQRIKAAPNLPSHGGGFAFIAPLVNPRFILLVVQFALTEKSFAADAAPRLKLAPVYRLSAAEGKQQLVTHAPMGALPGKSGDDSIAFLTVVSDEWPEGLVPLFGVEKNDRFELRRRPDKGQENFTAPLFFALPADEELASAKLAGRWECLGKHGDGSKKYLAFELAIEGEHVAGRFDQNTDFRFAFITSGTFRSNRIELKVEYVQDRYSLTGVWRDGKLTGTWCHIEDADHGTWEAARPRPKSRLEQPSTAVPLYEWHRASDGARRYTIEADLGEPGWERAARPLCRVWRN